MSSSLRRGALAASVLVLSIASLSACAAGNKAQTLEVKPDNAATTVGDIRLQNMNVITQPDLESKGPAVITGKLFNNGRKDQTLKAITIAGKNTAVKITPAGGSGKLVVPAGGAVVFGGKGNASAVVENAREALKDGTAQKLTFDFSDTGEVGIAAFVVPAKSFFKEWGPESEAPAASSKPSGQPGGQAGQNGQTGQTGQAGKPGEADTAGQPGATPSANQQNRTGQQAQQPGQGGQQHAGH
ncbi:DUF461 domain-containing protein [Streptomyces sp. UNOC14_S4]|uniref:DUF461 domain-containing protein n=1 Tax=Streptomyces sp. UNOC14_S4 TaxID=2872340 RepID=UPI001E51448B|nr:DUF461 domain-containing protein [Streptomyces sp. UNOC14_S4]MCC3769785.1 DUF461 domain-containing protein [Streptomyces sp. UNOC14_S4]